MSASVVVDGLERWYHNYKEPFEQLEGGYPGMPKGALLYEPDTLRPVCHYCNKAFDNLGRHAAHRHGMGAKDYKREVGLLQKSSLVSERVRQATTAATLRRVKSDPGLFAQQMTIPPEARKAKRPHAYRGRSSAEFANRYGVCYAQVLAVARSIVAAGKPLSHQQLNRHGIFANRVNQYFGSIDGLRRLVGSDHPLNAVSYSDTELLSAIRNLAQMIGRTPSASDLRRHGLPNWSTYKKHFGSYSEACRRAGLDPNLPVPNGRDIEVALLTAYASTGRADEAARIVGVGEERLTKVFAKYGAPLNRFRGRGHGWDTSQRRAWASDMARRLSGWPEVAA